MLRPASEKLAQAAFYLGSFGFIVGAVWIGSRASISALVQFAQTAEMTHLIELYEVRYEALLSIIRATTLLLSVIFIYLTLTGRTYYKRWMTIFSPILLIIANFIIYAVAPQIGKHLMPIALNVAFFIFFTLSLMQARSAYN